MKDAEKEEFLNHLSAMRASMRSHYRDIRSREGHSLTARRMWRAFALLDRTGVAMELIPIEEEEHAGHEDHHQEK